MQLSLVLTSLLLVSAASAAPSQSATEQGSNAQASQNVPVVGASVVQPVESVQQPPNVEHGVHSHQPVPGYYAPAGVIQVVGAEQAVSGGVKPQVGQAGSQVVRQVEQYGQPEPASIPANYKPFGSWGLYIGGNPADGYYTNYYKALSNSVEAKQQAGEGNAASGSFRPQSGGSQVSALSPMLRQAGSSPYVGGDYYPFAYSTNDFNSGARYAMEPVAPVQYAAGGIMSPVQAGAQVYGAPMSYETNYPSSYSEEYASRKIGSSYVQKEASATKEAPKAPVTAKGYQSRVYVYPSVVAAAPASPFAAPPAAYAAPVAAPAVSQAQQVVAYPVPVSSQIVGSQPGVDGAFSPYGVHAFTRYAIKPAVVSQQEGFQYGVHQAQGQAYPVYKQSVYQSGNGYTGNSYYPLSYYYGYPVGQPLHYSQGSVVGAPQVSFGEPAVHHSFVQPVPAESANDKPESSEADKAQVNKQQ